MTCHSGCMGEGLILLKNNKTVIITSCSVNEVSYNFFLANETVHAELNHVATGALSGSDPLGNIIDGDNNDDSYISLWEIWNYSYGHTLMRSTPQLYDTGGYSEYMYLDDEEMVIENPSVNFNGKYWSDNFSISNSSLRNGSNIEIISDNFFSTSGDFEVELGSEFTIK